MHNHQRTHTQLAHVPEVPPDQPSKTPPERPPESDPPEPTEIPPGRPEDLPPINDPEPDIDLPPREQLPEVRDPPLSRGSTAIQRRIRLTTSPKNDSAYINASAS